MQTRLRLGSLSLVLDLTMKKGVAPCTNWSGAGAALLISPRQDETSQYEGICVAWQAGSQENVHVRPPHGARRCVNTYTFRKDGHNCLSTVETDNCSSLSKSELKKEIRAGSDVMALVAIEETESEKEIPKEVGVSTVPMSPDRGFVKRVRRVYGSNVLGKGYPRLLG